MFFSVKTTAKRVGDDLVINGSKMWITNAFQADWICLLANTSSDKPIHMNKSLICVPMDTPGRVLSKSEIHVPRLILKKTFLHKLPPSQVLIAAITKCLGSQPC